MSETTPAANVEHPVTVTIELSPERSEELRRLASVRGEDITVVATQLLQTEIEAEHGLTYGPYLRKYMYR